MHKHGARFQGGFFAGEIRHAPLCGILRQKRDWLDKKWHASLKAKSKKYVRAPILLK